MRASSPRSFFSLVLIFSSRSLITFSAASPTLDKLCNSLDPWYIEPQLCHDVLDSDPQSSTADLNGFGIIAANIAASKATSVVSEIQHLLSNSSSGAPDRQKALKTCLDLYTNVIPELKGAVESIKAKKYSAVDPVLIAALKVPKICDDVTHDSATSPSSPKHYDFNSAFAYEVIVAYGIAGYLARYSG